jgi:predicted nucleic acid-binding protein
MLIDTNIFIEIAREQRHKAACRDFIDAISFDMVDEEVYISRFSLSAVEAVLSESTHFVREILLLIFNGKIKVKDTTIDDDLMINSVKKDLDLDFDDAVQFIAANKLGTYLVTYDKDFSNTSIQTKTPEEVLEELAKG